MHHCPYICMRKRRKQRRRQGEGEAGEKQETDMFKRQSQGRQSIKRLPSFPPSSSSLSFLSFFYASSSEAGRSILLLFLVLMLLLLLQLFSCTELLPVLRYIPDFLGECGIFLSSLYPLLELDILTETSLSLQDVDVSTPNMFFPCQHNNTLLRYSPLRFRSVILKFTGLKAFDENILAPSFNSSNIFFRE